MYNSMAVNLEEIGLQLVSCISTQIKNHIIQTKIFTKRYMPTTAVSKEQSPSCVDAGL